jgi:serine/threonine protein kinase
MTTKPRWSQVQPAMSEVLAQEFRKESREGSMRNPALKLAVEVCTELSVDRKGQREVELLAALNACPRVQRYHAWALTDAHVLIATELCPESLAQHVARQPRLSLADRLRLMRQAAEGVAWLHAAAVVHTALKPANMLVAADGSLKLADVGLGVRLLRHGRRQADGCKPRGREPHR